MDRLQVDLVTIIYATVSGAATTTTLEAFDRIDAGAGSDTMVVTLSGGNFVDVPMSALKYSRCRQAQLDL